jgi:nickel-dependent lactate racemase
MKTMHEDSAMRVAIHYGLEDTSFEVRDTRLVSKLRLSSARLQDPVAAVRDALEHPYQYPALRLALTPDDRVAVIVDESLPDMGRLLVPILEHITSAEVRPESITVVCPTTTDQAWVDDLPDELQEVRLEVHDPKDRKRLSYLATTGAGRRIYLNRSVGEADQVVVLGRRRFDVWHGQGGAGGDLFPALSDEPTRQELGKRWNLKVPGDSPWPLQQETEEVVWLMGMPFFVQLIDGPGDSIAEVIAGTAQARAQGQRRLHALWQQEVAEPAAVVLATISGDPNRHTFADLAAAVASAARVVQSGGRIVLLTEAQPQLNETLNALRQSDDAHEALQRLKDQPQRPELLPALLWARSAEHARISLLSKLPEEAVEELFAAPLSDVGQAQRWLDHSSSTVILEDAHKTLAVLASRSLEKHRWPNRLRCMT